MSSAGLFGRVLPKPASKFPVKRYNFLVPDIFPVKAVDVDEDLSSAVKKHIEKLQEYVSKNSERAPKVSRRLDRKIRKCLIKKKKYGNIKIAVHAFIYLLQHSNKGDAVLYAQELVKDQPVIAVGREGQCVPGGVSSLFSSSQGGRIKGSLIRLLLEHHSIHLRILGAELLAHFLQQQTDGDNQAEIESLVPIVSRNCRHPAPSELDGTSNGKVQELRTAGLRALRELIAFMERLSAAPQHLDDLIATVLDNIHPKEVAQAVASMEGEEPPAELDARKSQLASMKKTTLDFSFCEDAGMGDDFASASTSEEIATQIMAELGHLTKAARSAEKILTAVLRALDERHGWKADEPVVAASVGVLHQAFAEQHHQFLLFTVLLRHASSADHLSVSERACLIRLAVNEGLSQERHFLSAVLAQCLTHLPAQLPLLADVPVLGSATSTSGGELDVPKPLPKANGNMEEEDLRTAVLDSIAEVSGSIEDTGVLVDELTRILAQLRLPNGLGKGDSADAVVAVLECVAAALRAVVLRPDEGRKIPFSKKNDMFLELLSLHLSLPALPRLQIHRLLQILVPAGIGESTLPPALVSGFLTAVYNELLDANLVPESFVAIAGTFAVVMRSSDARGWVTGLQFVNLLVTMALKDHETSSLALGAVRQGAIILLANTSLLQLSMVVDCPDLETATLDTGDILKPCLRISITNAGQMQAFSQAFPDKLDRQATEQLRNLCESEPDLPGRLIKLGCKVSSLRNAFGSQLEDMLGTCFSPDSSDGIPQRAKRPLSQGRCSTPEGSISPCEPEATEQTRAMDFSRKVLAVLSKGSSWKEGPYQMPRPRSVQELLAVDENDADTTKNSTGGDNGGEEDEPDGKKTTSRTAALKSVLSMLDREHGSDGKTNSLNMDDLVLGLDPIS